jgi:DEAD/DEAH box helicase domain-containing protein
VRTYTTVMPTTPNARARALLEELAGGDERLIYLHETPARAARFAALSEPVSPLVSAAFGNRPLWLHQAAAIDHARAGRSVVVATGTASGKSLCYQLPIIEAVTEQQGTALAIFPTKALAQDQLRSLTELDLPGMFAATYDGDTTPEARKFVRARASVVLTNPEMLHTSMLPYHGRWANFLRRLRYVVVDELHVLRGVFGSHVGHVLRRLRRLANLYGADPVFVFSSATIGDPARLARDLCGLDVVSVSDDGSPRGARLFALWNPPIVDVENGVRAPSNGEVAALVAALVTADFRTVAFCRSRRGTEVVTADIKGRLPDSAGSLVRSYRAGYLPAERREIEAELFTGQLRAIVATSALELGIDVGGLDACVLNGFPGTLSSMWQQAGRAGRRDDPALAVLVAGSDQLDQWLMAHPREVFQRPLEPAMAFERPLREVDDETYWGEDLADGVRDLVVDDRLRVRDGAAYWQGRGSPAPGIGLRSGSSQEFRIADGDGRVIGTIDGARAFETVHPGAIYLHLGQQYRVTRLDLADCVAWVEAIDVDEYTQARSHMDVTVLSVQRETVVGRASLYLGMIEVASQVTGFELRNSRTRKRVRRVPLDLPKSRLETQAFWYTVTDEVLGAARVSPEEVPGALHAVEHAGIGILPLFAICDRWDVGGVSTAFQADTGLPSIFIYDGYPGGIGIAEMGFANGRRHLEATRAVIERCRCTRGCPSCVQSPKCGNGNDPLDKAAAVGLLRTILA